MKKLFISLLIPSIQLIVGISLSLNGNDWFASNQNKSIRVTAKVPGSIYTDLIRSNVLKENPYYGSNDYNYKWVSYDNWTYDKMFTVNESVLNNKGVYLICHGLDTISNIYLNGNPIASTDNSFIRYKFDIKPYLRLGLNSISIAFESAVTYAKKKHDQYIRTKYIVPPESMPFVQRGELHANYIRKMQSSFSWDWGPSFPTQGIWKDIEIETIDSAIIRDITVNTIPDTNNKWILNITFHLETVFNDAFDSLIQISLYDTIIYRKLLSLTPSSGGSVSFYREIPVNDSFVIHPWYPNGIGSQMLYDLTVILTTTEINLTKKIRIGFRTIELIQDPIKPKGLTFYFKVNGRPFYAKGSNWIPAHVFPELLTTDYIRHILQSAKDANMNMLRVWGGGIYESDAFYDIADEMGIFIWQDFMFACALYPVNQDFIDSVSTEVTQQVRRLQHHPSIAVWAGNNENEAAIAQSWWPEIWVNLDIYKRDYIKLYIETIREIVLKEDFSGIYLSSSPSNGLETIKENWLSGSPQDNRFGDVHFYYYSNDAWDWRRYPSTKFASEYGFQSFPSLKTLSKVINSSELRYPLSESVSERQHHTSGNYEITNLIDNYMKLPISGGKERFEDFIYLSQIAQAMSLKTETEFYRRNRIINAQNGEGFTMGALYWQLNDIWEAPTWSSIEFGGKWKMSHYFAKNMFENVLIVAFEDNNMLKVDLINDNYLNSKVSLNISIKVFKWSSLKPLYEINEIAETDSISSKNVYQNLISNVISSSNCVDRKECLIGVSAENIGNNWRSNNFLFLSSLRDAIGIKRPNLTIASISGPHSYPNYIYDIVLETNSIAPFVWLDFTLDSYIVGEFSDNGFLLLTNRKFLQFFGQNSYKTDEIKSQITIKSLTDVKTVE